jgi:hypothetical protein
VIRRGAVVALVVLGLAGCRTGPDAGTGPSEPTSGIARVTAVHGDVRVRRSGYPDWKAAAVATWLEPRDQLSTASDGTAQLLYGDGTKIDVNPGSLLEVAPSQTSSTGGNIGIITQKSSHSFRDAGKNLDVVVNPESSAVVRSNQEQMQFTVDKGGGSIKQKGVTVPVNAGEGVEAKGGGIAPKFTLPAAPALVSPADGSEASYLDPARSTTTLHWDAVPSAVTYNVQVADEPAFGHPRLDSRKRPETSAEVPALLGTFHWRVQAVDAHGNESPWSAAGRFTISRRPPPTPTSSSVPLHIDDIEVKGNVVFVRGTTAPGATVTVDDQRISVDESGQFREHVAIAETGSHVLVVRASGKGSPAEERRTIQIEP